MLTLWLFTDSSCFVFFGLMLMLTLSKFSSCFCFIFLLILTTGLGNN